LSDSLKLLITIYYSLDFFNYLPTKYFNKRPQLIGTSV